MPFHGAGNKHQGSGYRIQNPVDHGNQIVLANIYFDDQIKLFLLPWGSRKKVSFSGQSTKKRGGGVKGLVTKKKYLF